MTDDQYTYKHLHQARLEHERHEELLSFLNDRATKWLRMLNIRLHTYEEIEVPTSILDAVNDPAAEKVIDFHHVAYDEYGRDEHPFLLGLIPIPVAFLFSDEDTDDAAYWHRVAREMGWVPTSNAKLGDAPIAKNVKIIPNGEMFPTDAEKGSAEGSRVRIVPNPVAAPFPEQVQPAVAEYVPVYELHPEDQAYADHVRSLDQ